jgi:Trypsin-co-occurring domain 1
MGNRVVQFKIGQQGTLLVEVDEAAGNRAVAKGVIEKARQSLEESLAAVTPGINAMVEHLQELASNPDEFGLEFGIKFTAEAGAIVAKTAVEGNITVNLKWAKKPALPTV